MRSAASVVGRLSIFLAGYGPAVAAAQSFTEQYNLAASYYARAQWEDAAAAFGSLVQEFDTDERVGLAAFYLGESTFQLRRYAQAQQAYQQFIRQLPEHANVSRAHFRMAELTYLSGAVQQAREQLQQFVQQYPSDPLLEYALPYLGQICLAEGEHPAAEDWYERALQRYPDSPLADHCRLGIAQALAAQQRVDEAIRFYGYLIDQRSPLQVQARLETGKLQLEQGELASAARTLAQIAGDDTVEGAQARYWLARSLEAAGNLLGAHDQLISINYEKLPEPLVAPARIQRAVLAIHRQQWSDARIALDQVDLTTASDSQRRQVSALEIELAFYLNRHDDVVQWGMAFEQQYAGSQLATYTSELVARSLHSRQQYREAVAQLKRLIDTNPDAEPKKAAQWGYLLALAQLGLNESVDAQRTLAGIDESQLDDGERAGVRLARGRCAFAGQDYHAAIAAFEALLLSATGADEAQQCRGDLVLAYARTGQYERAAETFDAIPASLFESEQCLIALNVGEIAEQSGDLQESERWYRRVLQRCCDPQQLAAALARLIHSSPTSVHEPSVRRALYRLAAFLPSMPDTAKVMLSLGKWLYDAREFRAGADVFELVSTRLSHDEGALRARIELATGLVQLGTEHDLVRAEQQLKIAVSDAQQSGRGPSAQSLGARALHELAWLQHKMDKREASLASFARLANEYPESRQAADAGMRLALAALDRGAVSEAREHLVQVIQGDVPGELNAQARFLLGKIAFDTAQWVESAENFRKLVDSHPQSPLKSEAQFWIAEIQYRSGDYEAAEKSFAILCSKEDELYFRAALRRAQSLVQLEEWSEIWSIADQLREAYSSDSQWYHFDYLIGRCLASRAEFDQARQAFQAVVDSPHGRGTETAAISQWMIGETYFHQQRFDDAVIAYYRVDSLYDYPEWRAAALLQAARCHERLQQPQTAQRLYREICREFSDTKAAADAQSSLQAQPTTRPAVNSERR